MKKVILITGASSGIGYFTAIELARHGHTVYASMRSLKSKNGKVADKFVELSIKENLDIIPIELDVTDDNSVKTCIDEITNQAKSIDVLIHNAGHMSFGPAESFSLDQFNLLFETNVFGTQRVNKEVLPIMRSKRSGLLIWISSSSVRGGTPPLLGPYFSAKAAMDSLAVTYATELTQWGVETSIVVPGAYLNGTSHFQNAMQPSNLDCKNEYILGPLNNLDEKIKSGLEARTDKNADPSDISKEIVRIVELEKGERPFRVHIDPCDDGCEVVSHVADRVRSQFLKEIGLEKYLNTTIEGSKNEL